MAKETEGFMEAGLVHYPAARLAVRRFEETIRQQLADVLRRDAVAHSQVSFAAGRSGKLYIEASQWIGLGSSVEAKVTVGLSWEVEAPYFYVYCAEGPEWTIHPAGERFVRDGGTTYFVEPEGSSRGSVPERIERLFNEWLASLEEAGHGRQ